MISTGRRRRRGVRTMSDDDVLGLVRRVIAARRRDALAPAGDAGGVPRDRVSWRVVRRHRAAAAVESQVARVFAERGDDEAASAHQEKAARERVLADTEELRSIERP